jgi:acylphosphatase
MKVTSHTNPDGTVAVTIKGDAEQIEVLAAELDKAGSAETPRVANLGNDFRHVLDNPSPKD